MIDLRDLGKSFGATRAVDALSLSIDAGELLVLLGSSGSGKSTLLKMINRLVEHDSGEIIFSGRPIRSLRPEELRRRMGYVIQSIGLFPHWNVARNIAIVPRLLGWPAGRIATRVDELLALFGLDPAQFSERFPHQLSGGQQQRVGVARALAADPEVLLMDEPFGALDPVTRLSLQQELARLHRASGKTIVLVTHDIDEALRLATRIVLLEHGRIVQQGTPAQLLANPANEHVADFLGRDDLGWRLLGLHTVVERMRAGEHLLQLDDADAESQADRQAGSEAIAAGSSLQEALSIFVTRRTDRLSVVDEGGRPLGVLHLADLSRPAR